MIHDVFSLRGLDKGTSIEYVSCEPTESARELFDEDCEPVEEEQ